MSQPLNFVILTGGVDDATSFRRALAEERRIRIVAASDKPEQVYADVVRWKPAAVIINTGSGTGKEPDWTLCRQVNAVCPETIIICASHNSSPDLILDSLRAGAREFLRLPIDAGELRTVVNRVAEIAGAETNAGRNRGRVIAAYSNKGGCGTSFIAANLAAALDRPAALVDLNLQAPTQDLLFGVKPKYSIADLARNRLDDRPLSGFLVEYSPKLSLLAAPLEAEAAEDVRTEHVVEVIEMLRERYDFVVLDLPHTFDAITITALDHADEILLVLTLDILAARSAQRALAIFRRLGYPNEKIRLVLNRWSRQSDLELRHVERYLGERIPNFISDDYSTVVGSINLGKPLVETQSQATIVAELKRLAAVCGGTATPESESHKNVLDSLLGSVRRQTGKLMARKPAVMSVARS
ncbi:MAG: AAA family ATPase [Blastocatellia bacterium]